METERTSIVEESRLGMDMSSYGNQMPKSPWVAKVEFVCSECGGLGKHLRSCSHYVCDERCDYCQAPEGMPHHVDCPEE